MEYRTDERDYIESTGTYRKKGVLLYKTRETYAGDYLEVEHFPVLDIEHETKQKACRTKAAQQELNLKNAQKKLARLLNANFGTGDLLVHLTMAQHCEEKKVVQKTSAYIRRIKRRYNKRGAELKYIYVIESTGAGDNLKWHIHMVMNGGILSRDEVEEQWKEGLSRVDRCKRQEKGLTGFAKYITMRKETQKRLLKRKWGASKGLKQPETRENKTKFSRRAVERIAIDAGENAYSVYEKKYLGYRVIEKPEIRYNDFLPGAYIYIMLEKI